MWFQLCLLIFLLAFPSDVLSTWYNQKLTHSPSSISANDLKFISSLSNETSFNQTLSKIAIPRVMGTKGHDSVKQFIVQSMKDLNWSVEVDTFSQDTVIGNIQFDNIVATLDPTVSRHLVLACHYDSKMDREKAWVLATDSAVPCSMMIHMAQLLDPQLKDSRSKGSNVTLQLIFFDGEEAFRDWTATDSIYGSRHLADKMHRTAYPQSNTQGTTLLHKMDVMVLLDLLGARNPTFVNFFPETENLFRKMQEIEQQLNQNGLIQTSSHWYFTNDFAWQGVEDDHIPFLRKGVRILHLIPTPFPRVWHTEKDTVANLDFKTIDNLNKIFRTFVCAYLHLNVSGGGAAP